MDRCMMEYIALLAPVDSELSHTIDGIVAGQIRHIKVDDADMKAGGALSKSVPRPKVEDTTQYMNSLTHK